MKLKIELKKISFCLIFLILLIVYLDSNRLRGSILDGLENLYRGFLFDFKYILIFLLFLFIAYILYNTLYYIIFLVLTYINKKTSGLFLTNSIIVAIFCIIILNDQLINHDLKDYRNESFFKPTTFAEVTIDSNNFTEFNWQRKQYTISDPGYIITEEIIFHKDSTFTISGNRIKFDRFYIIRKMLQNNIEYKITRPYVYQNGCYSSISFFDSTTAYPLQIRNERLYLNTGFY